MSGLCRKTTKEKRALEFGLWKKRHCRLYSIEISDKTERDLKHTFHGNSLLEGSQIVDWTTTR